MSASESVSKFIVIAHRCLGYHHPENTVRSLQAALLSNVDAVEVDIRLTKDKKWVAIHDAFMRDEEKRVVHVHENTLSKLRRVVTPLETMLAVFAAFGNGKTLFIDVKDVGETRSLVRMVQQYQLTENVMIIAWEPEVLRRIHRLDESIRIGFSYVPIHSSLTVIKGALNKPMSRHKVVMRFNVEQRFEAKLGRGVTHQHYLATIPDLPLYSIQVPGALCSSKLVRLAHERGFMVYPFVVNTRIGVAILKRRGVDGILTNSPRTFVKE